MEPVRVRKREGQWEERQRRGWVGKEEEIGPWPVSLVVGEGR